MSQESFVTKVCNCLETLINGKKSESSSNKCNLKDRKEALFYELRKNVHFAFDAVEKYDDVKCSVKQYLVICDKKECKTCDYLNFLELSLVFLKLLSEALFAEENEQNSTQSKACIPKGLLSISQQKMVKKSLQFVVALGILPNLLHGIGVPLCKRLEYSKMLEHFASDISPRQKHAQIAACLETLLSCMERSALQSIILSYHGTDLLAALFQLCHAPIKKIESKNNSDSDDCKVCPEMYENYFAVKLSIIKDYSSFTDQQLINEMKEDRRYFTPKLERFLKQICPSILLWELLLFQGIPMKIDNSEFTLAKVPLWLRKICSRMLTDMILQSHGVASFVQVVLDKAYDVDIQLGNVDTVRLDAVARLVVFNPVRHTSFQDYIHQLSKQVLDLLQLKGSPMDTMLQYVASNIVLYVCEKDMKSAEKYFLDVLFQPLRMCVNTTGDSKIVVQEKALFYCLEGIHKIFVMSDCPLSRKYIRLLFPFFHCLSYMYFFLLEGVSSLKPKVKALLLNILSSANDEDAICLLHAATFSTIDNKGTLVHMTTVNFAYGEEGGIRAVKRIEDDFSDLDINCRGIMGLLSEIKNKNLNRTFILLVLKIFCSYHNEDPEDPKYKRFRNLFVALNQELLQSDIDVREALMSNVTEVIDNVVILMDIVSKWEDDDCDETINMLLMLLYVLIYEKEELSSSQWAMLKKCLPSLEKLKKGHINSNLKDMVCCIITSIETHGVAGGPSEEVLQNCSSKHSNGTMKKEQHLAESSGAAGSGVHDKNLKPEQPFILDSSHIEKFLGNISDCSSSDKSSDLASDLELILKHNRDSNRRIDELTDFEKAIQDIKYSSVITKGPGLIAIRKLLNIRDKETLRYKNELLSIFQECLGNADTYVYSNSIQCLALLADIDAELVFPTVLEVFQIPGDKDCELILKVGEVIYKIIRSLGEHVYKYRDQLLHTCLIGAKHKDPQIRCSSLSNLGEACKYLKFNIDHWLQEILVCVWSFFKTDKEIEVRRSAIMVITLLLQGVGRDAFQILNSEMKDIYGQLKFVLATESDDALCAHSQLALDEIKAIMREHLTVQQPFTKEIRILH